MSLKDRIKGSPKLKRVVYSLMMSSKWKRPRLWLRLAKPFYTKIGKNSAISNKARWDCGPFHPFVMGDNSIIPDQTTLNNQLGEIIIGDHVMVGLNNTLMGPIEIQDHVWLAQNVVLAGLHHIYDDADHISEFQGDIVGKIVIEHNVWIAANTVITQGVTIGHNSVVGANSVVTSDLPPYTLSAGSPARPIKTYNKETKKWEKIKQHTK